MQALRKAMEVKKSASKLQAFVRMRSQRNKFGALQEEIRKRELEELRRQQVLAEKLEKQRQQKKLQIARQSAAFQALQALTGRVLQLTRDPSRGGWPGYEPWFRELLVLQPLHVVKHTKWHSSWKRWRRLQAQSGSLMPLAHGGGARRELGAMEQALLHALKLAHPHATLDECRAAACTRAR